MARYIDADEVRYRLFSVAITDDLYGMGMSKGIDVALKIINDQPTADVVEVKHAYWIDLNIAEWQCSECKYRVERWNNTPYCPECGAKMDGGKAE